MHLDSIISALLFEAESAELDFKREQYVFEGANDRAKSELLKDILAFANAWRRTDAYILIGIQEVKEAASEVVGIAAHIDDAKLQQFVNSKTNRPVEFSYTPMTFRGMQIGVIHIPVQERPTFLTRDYGHLRRNTVYLRRGSSTDEARPDEIARMGQALSENLKPRPFLVPRIATGSDWSTLVEVANFESMRLIHPEINSLPDYSPHVPTGPFGEPLHLSIGHTNQSFYRERAEYLRFYAKLRPIRLALRNEGTALASGTKLVAELADPAHAIEFVLGSDQPNVPRREWSHLYNIKPISMNNLSSPDIEVIKTKAGWTIVSYFGKVQAKDTAVTSEQLFVGVTQSGRIEFPITVYADELSNPVSSLLSLNFSLSEREFSYDELTR